VSGWLDSLPDAGERPDPDHLREAALFPAVSSAQIDPRQFTIHNMPRVRVKRTTDLSIAHGTWTYVGMDTTGVVYDSEGMFDVGQLATLTIQTPGVWDIGAFVSWRDTPPGTNPARIIAIQYTPVGQAIAAAGSAGSQISRSNQVAHVYGYAQCMECGTKFKFDKGDRIHLLVYQEADTAGAQLISCTLDAVPWSAAFYATYDSTAP